MAKYKAKDSYKTAENTYFNIGTVDVLKRGGTLDMKEKEFEKLPEDVKGHFELIEKKKKEVSKPDTKKKKKEKEINNE